MKHGYKILWLFLPMIIFLTGCNKQDKAYNDTNPKNITTPSLTPTDAPTDAPLQDMDPFHFTESDELYPFLSTGGGVRKYGYFKLNGEIIIDAKYQKASLFHDNVAVILTEETEKKNRRY